MRPSILKRIFVMLLAICVISTLFFQVSVAETKGFSLRGGIQFGMSPEEIIAIENSNGYFYSLTAKGNILYDTGYDYQLYYDTNIGNLGSLPITRFEYDFDYIDKKLYQFYYVFKDNSNAFEYLSSALSRKYWFDDTNSKYSTQKYKDTGAKSHISQKRWTMYYDDYLVVIDLWNNTSNVCFLAYQSYSSQQLIEQESLDFGL